MLTTNFIGFIKNIVDGTSKILREDGLFICILLISNFPVIFEPLKVGGKISEYAEHFFLSIFPLIFIALVLHFLLIKLPKVKRILQVAISFVFLLLSVTDIFLLYKFDTNLNGLMVEILLGTNILTAKEFLQSYVFAPAQSIKILIITAVVLLFLIKSVKLIKSFLKKRIQWISGFLIIAFLSSMTLWLYYAHRFEVSKIFDDKEKIAEQIYRIHHLAYGTLIFRTIYYAYDFSNYYPIVNRDTILGKMDKVKAEILSNDSNIPYVVFILGEATTKNHMQLYGYKLETNPLLTERYNAGEILKFDDTIACANNTSRAMSLIFTFSEKDTKMNEWYLTPNLFDILNGTGYHTVWISNQSPQGLWGNFDYIFANRCNDIVFTEKNTRRHDDVLLPELDKFLEKPYDKNFYLLHIYGTHASYEDRYPKEFEKFIATDEDKPTENGREITAAYDNAVLYNDYIVDEIIRRFEDKNALIIYISDHGEEVFEGREFFGHSTESHGNYSMIEIPFIIWTSQKFRETYPEKISALSASLEKPYRTDLMINMILELMDIRTNYCDPTKSIINEKFDTSFKRIYNGKLYTKN